jgi:hypothetical protein
MVGSLTPRGRRNVEVWGPSDHEVSQSIYSARLFRWGALAQPYLDRSTGYGKMMRTHLTRIRKHTSPAFISLLSCDYGTPSHAIAIYQNTNSSAHELLGFECNTTMQTSKKGKAKVVIHVGLMQRCQIQMEGYYQ